MIFSLRKLQEKRREQCKPLYIAFIDLTKAFDLVSREGLFNIPLKIGCPPKFHSLIRSSNEDAKTTIQYEGSMSDCSYSILLVLQLKGFTYTPGPMANCSVLLD